MSAVAKEYQLLRYMYMLYVSRVEWNCLGVSDSIVADHQYVLVSAVTFWYRTHNIACNTMEWPWSVWQWEVSKVSSGHVWMEQCMRTTHTIHTKYCTALLLYTFICTLADISYAKHFGHCYDPFCWHGIFPESYMNTTLFYHVFWYKIKFNKWPKYIHVQNNCYSIIRT